MERWLKGFAKISLEIATVLGLLGIIALGSSVSFSLSGTGEPLIWLGVSLALFSVTLGCFSVFLSDKSDKKIQAIADMKFDEIIGLINPVENLPSTTERTVSSIRPALRISEWANRDSKAIFSVEMRKLIDKIKSHGIDEELALKLEEVWQEHEIDKWF